VDLPASDWLLPVLAAGPFLAAPAVAWTAWLRRPRPRPRPLLVVAIVTSLPLISACTGFARIMLVVRPSNATLEMEPSQKARQLGETISESMNLTALAFIVAVVGSGGVIAWSRWRRRHRRHAAQNPS
jgi:hypothetical protein